MPPMRRSRSLLGYSCAAVFLLLDVTGCGDDTRIPQAGSATAFASPHVSITQRGTSATIDTGSVTFALDASRSVVVHLSIRANVPGALTVTVRGSLYDPQQRLIGDVSGGRVNVTSAQPSDVTLTGPTPLGTIDHAVFEVSAVPLPS